MSRLLLLTFDVEDFINEKSMSAVRRILSLLRFYDIGAIFFITGHMVERLQKHPEVVGALVEHEIGFHSSGHTVRPTINEYTDLPDYKDAYDISLIRENSRINPLTGETEGEGGLVSLRQLFPDKEIRSFRYPGLPYCSPPHLEALKCLGIDFDFSAGFSNIPVVHEGITFYPVPSFFDWESGLGNWTTFVESILRNKFTVLDFHPNMFVNMKHWDSIYHKGNPPKLCQVPSRGKEEIVRKMRSFEMVLKTVKKMEKSKIIEVTNELEKSSEALVSRSIDIEQIVAKFSYWSGMFLDFKPKYLKSHLIEFFN